MISKEYRNQLIIILICLFVSGLSSYGQALTDEDLDLMDIDNLSAEDSISIFSLLDELMSEQEEKSDLRFRLGYGGGSSTLASSKPEDKTPSHLYPITINLAYLQVEPLVLAIDTHQVFTT